jgi:hypothetical protein
MASSHIPHPTASTSPQVQRQLSMAFDSPLLQGMTAAERANVLTHLTQLLLQAAGIQTEGNDDEER